jgi:glycosyltransferase involved in cell wall biosynthesis
VRVFFPNGTISFPPTKGPHIHKYQLTKNLRSLGYEVTTFHPDQNPEVKHVPKNILSTLKMLRQSNVIYLRIGEGTSSASALTSRMFRWLIPNETVVIWEMNLGVDLNVRRIARTRKKIRRDLRALRTQAKRVDAAICVTEKIADQARRILGIEHVYTLQNGSDPDMFRPDLKGFPTVTDSVRPRVLNIAWIASEANAIHDVKLVNELARLIDRNELPLKIHAMGDTEKLFPCPVPSSVVIHGPVSYLDLPRYLASMDVGLVLYNIQYDGGSPLKLFDYCASGCVPICSPGQGIEAALKSSGAGYVQWWSAETLCSALENLRKEPDKLRAISKKARQLVEDRYNWTAIAVETDRVIRNCISRRAKQL